MIVKTGRQIIANTDLTDSNNLENFKFFLERSSSTSDLDYMTKPDMTLGNAERAMTTSTIVGSVPGTPTSNTLYVSYDSSNLQLKFTAFISGVAGSTEGVYAAAGLIYNSNTLFSRVTFKETTITDGSLYKMEYIIYF